MKKLLLTITSLAIGSYVFAQSTALHFDGLDDYVKITGHTDLSGPKTIKSVINYLILFWTPIMSSLCIMDKIYVDIMTGNDLESSI